MNSTLGTMAETGTTNPADLLLNDANQLIDWVQSGSKADIGRLAIHVFASAQAGDPLARRLVGEAAERLAQDALLCARHLFRRGQPVEFVLAGSTLLKQPQFANSRAGRRGWLARIILLPRESVWGAWLCPGGLNKNPAGIASEAAWFQINRQRRSDAGVCANGACHPPSGATAPKLIPSQSGRR